MHGNVEVADHWFLFIAICSQLAYIKSHHCIDEVTGDQYLSLCNDRHCGCCCKFAIPFME